MKIAAPLILAAAVSLLASCGDEASNVISPRPCGDDDDRELIVSGVLESYRTRDLDAFDELLHDAYTFFLQAGDLMPGEPASLTRSEDSLATAILFQRAEKLNLAIDAGTWTPLDSLDGRPCFDCWETIRLYAIAAQLTDAAGTTYLGSDLVRIVVTCVEEVGGGRYAIRRMDDIDVLRYARVGAGTDDITWGRLKRLYLDD